MMPLYSSDKFVLSEEGTEDEYSLVFIGDCKWHVDAYTQVRPDIEPFTDEELERVGDGDYWDVTLCQKSILLDCDIMCNSKDIDGGGRAYYERYNRGIEIYDECPKELHIKRGREYDFDGDFEPEGREAVAGTECKVKFEKGTYMYVGDYEVGDLVYVEGAKSGCLGRVIEAKKVEDCNAAYYNIVEKIGHADAFNEKAVVTLWDSHAPFARKEWLKKLGLDEKLAKKKFISIMEWQWTNFAVDNNNWDDFIASIT